MGNRLHLPSALAWLQRASSAVRRLRPGPPAIALFAAEALAVLVVLALLVKPFAGDSREPAAVVQPSASPAARPSDTPPAGPLAEANEAARPVFDPAAVFGNLPPPIVEETFEVSPFDSPRLDGGIYRLNPDGTQLVRIATEIRAPRLVEHQGDSALSPDGRWLAFVSVIPAPRYIALPAQVVVYMKDLASHEPARAVANLGSVSDLIVSPDGRKLMLLGSIEVGVANPVGRGIYLIDIAAQTVSELPELESARTVRWSPTGDQILFRQIDSGKSALYIADGDGESVRRLLDDVSGDAAWSPDGSQIVIADCCQREGTHLVRLDGTTTSLRNVRPLDDPLYPSQFSWSPDGSRIAFHTREYSSDALTLNAVDVNTGEVADLGPGENPTWSHDGSRIAYLRDGKLYIALPDGREAWPVISPEQSFISSVAWSAHDSGFVLQYETSPMHAIWKMTATGDSQQFLAYGDTPVWSPDGTMIAFIGKTRSASEYGDQVISDNEVWVMNADGGDLHQIGEYRSFRSLLYPPNEHGCNRGLAWSTDGTQVVFDGSSERVAAPADGSAPPVEIGIGCGSGASPAGDASIAETTEGILVSDSEGREVLRLPGARAQWSPDGTSIAYWASGQVHVVDYPSGTTRTSDGYLQFDEGLPDLLWSPDGKRIAYVQRGEIYVVNVDDRAAGFRLNAGADPAWSPDGFRIAFAYDDPALGTGIYVTTSDNRGWRFRIADGTGPAWSPDGTQLAFLR